MLKKLLIPIFFMIVGSTGFSIEKSYYEDAEIKRLQEEITRIEARIKRLERSKEQRKNRESMEARPKVGLVLSGGGAKSCPCGCAEGT